MSIDARPARLFLSYNTRDRALVARIQDELTSRGVATYMDAMLSVGLPWFDQLERELLAASGAAIFVGATGLGAIQKREMWFALERQAQEEIAGRAFPVIPVLLSGADVDAVSTFLILNTWVDLRSDVDHPAALERIVGALRSVGDSAPGRTPPSPICPYRSLRAFREEDSPLFFGRDTFADSLQEKVTRCRLVVLVGASGSGKSSVVQAGLVPRLRMQRPPKDTWDYIIFTPGAHPFRRLAAELVPLWSPPDRSRTDVLAEAQSLGDRLASGAVTLAASVTEALRHAPDTTRLLVVVDQFEELFTLSTTNLRVMFVEQLLQATTDSNASLVITLRADFYGSLLDHSRQLTDALVNGLLNLGPMTRGEMRVAIEQPATRSGLRFQEGLVDRMLDDVAAQPGSLALLEFALAELWQQRRNDEMTHDAYTQGGGVSGAIARRANVVYQSLPPKQAARALPTLARLVHVTSASEEGGDTRHCVRMTDLDEDQRAIVHAFAAERLLVLTGSEQPGEDRVDVAHEALIGGWEPLRLYLDKEREFLLWRQRLAIQVDEWHRTNESNDALLRGRVLIDARRSLADRLPDLGDHERRFLEASEQSAKRQRNRALGPRRWAIVGASMLLLAIVIAATWMLWTRSDEYQLRLVEREIPKLIPSAKLETIKEAIQTLAVVTESHDTLDAASRLTDSYSRVAALAAAAEALVDAGRNAEAQEFAERAFAIVTDAKSTDDSLRFAGPFLAATALIHAGKLERAVELVDLLPDSDIRAQTMGQLATHFSKLGRFDAADATAIAAVTWTSQPIDAAVRIGVLADASEAFARIGNARAVSDAATRALAEVQSLPIQSGHQTLRPDIPMISCQSSQRVAEALRDSGRLDEASRAAETSLRLCLTAEVNNMSAALPIAKNIEILAEAGKLDDVRRHPREQLGIGFAWGCARGVRRLAASGRLDEARREALAIAGPVNVQIALGLIDAGKLDAAMSEARALTDAPSRVWAYAALSKALKAADRTLDAAKCALISLETATDGWLLIPPTFNPTTPWIVDDSRSVIVEIANNVTSTPEIDRAKAALTRARRATAQVVGLSDRTNALLGIAGAFMAMEARDEAQDTAREAYALARSPSFEDVSAAGYAAIRAIHVLIQAGASATALELATNKPLQRPEDQTRMCATIAQELAIRQDLQRAKEAARQAERTAQTVVYDYARSDAHRRAATALAAVGEYRAARLEGDRCTSSDDRLKAYTAILQLYAVLRSPALSKVFDKVN